MTQTSPRLPPDALPAERALAGCKRQPTNLNPSTFETEATP